MGDIELDAFLADSVASVQGKLYALGAGWNRIAVAACSRPATTAWGSGSWSGSRRVRPSRRVGSSSGCSARRDEDLSLGAGPEGPVNRIGGEFTAGGGEEQIVPIALNLNGLPLPGPGTTAS